MPARRRSRNIINQGNCLNDVAIEPLAVASGQDYEGQPFAAIDLGSNSFHMIVARYEHGTMTVVDRIKDMVRLAEGVDKRGRLSEVVAERALACLAQFGERIAAIPEANVRAVGTNALRRIHDGWRFLNEAEQRLGHSIEIISGQEEARLIYFGVAHAISERGNRRLVIDIGGGSTEFVIGREFQAMELESLYFGCVGIAQRFFEDGRITAKRWSKAHAAVALELQRIADDFRDTGWQEAIGSSGTMKAVRSVVINQGWSERGITPESMDALRENLLKAGHVDKISLSGMSERRRPVFASGAVIVEACLSGLGIDRLLVTDYALREGLLYDMLGRITHSDPRQGAIEALVARYTIDAAQAQRVRKSAVQLFKQVQSQWSLSANAGRLLGWAADIHELGLAISHHGYHRHGAYVIEYSDLPGFSKQEQAVLAAMVRSHRRKPSTSVLETVTRKIRGDVVHLIVLLRIAVLLNRTRHDRAIPVPTLKPGDGSLALVFPDGWSEVYPLAHEDLLGEVELVKRLDFQLSLSS